MSVGDFGVLCILSFANIEIVPCKKNLWFSPLRFVVCCSFHEKRFVFCFVLYFSSVILWKFHSIYLKIVPFFTIFSTFGPLVGLIWLCEYLSFRPSPVGPYCMCCKYKLAFTTIWVIWDTPLSNFFIFSTIFLAKLYVQ